MNKSNNKRILAVKYVLATTTCDVPVDRMNRSFLAYYGPGKGRELPRRAHLSVCAWSKRVLNKSKTKATLFISSSFWVSPLS